MSHGKRLGHWRKTTPIEEQAEAERAAVGYVKLLQDFMAEHDHSQLLLEQRVEPGLPSCWGTSDAVIVSPEHVHIVDFKYGMGVRVSAVENPQLMLYAVGALDSFGDLLGEAKTVFMTIHQPRLDATSTWSIGADELRAWRDDALVTAEEALGDHAHFQPSEDACRWCPAAGLCRAQMEQATAVDFAVKPDLLTPEELATLLPQLKSITSWCSAVDAAALDLVYSQGRDIPGYKVVLSGGRRSITDDAAAIQMLIDAGYPAETVADFKVKALGSLEKLVGKKDLPGILGDLIVKSEGKPALVPESDKRPAINPNTEARKEFS